MSCQAGKEYDAEQSLDEAPAGDSAGPPGKVAGVPTEQVARHRIWLQRKTPTGKKKASWRPVKQYRVASKKLLRCIVNQLRHGTTTGGLVCFSNRNRLRGPFGPEGQCF